MEEPSSVTISTKAVEENGNCGENVNLEPRFECPICLTWLRDPVLTSCGHKFCSQCIHTWLQKEGACCPVDSRPLKSENDLFRDLYTSREISQQRTNCPYQQFGCQVELSPVDMETHISQCTYKRNLSESQAVQGTTNAMSAESKLWDPPPKRETEVSEREGPPPNWELLLKNLYERLVILEQENRELTITVSNQKKQLTTLQTSVCFNQEEMYLRNCNGVYVWRLKSFQEKLTAMINDPLKMFYSPGFYTGSNGYKICARINVSSRDSNYLSLLLHIMKSENDDALDWPFYGTMCFVLVHPRNSENNIREITSSRPDLEAFRRPTCELNKRSFGYTEFVRLNDVIDFVQHDSLVFRIEVRAYDKYNMPST
ncbi:TNF receptor-associated factor 6 isoform X1 [Harpegnathos saltator]|uniref:TNF receptor-associated factor 6 n=1 Tax=Harpegnathos saltator TaxID=610380 RepID=E2C776_HARSA|nr:TNF receptor-associated factor 6 isoform X1 [Harpegnathos saltator]EFN76189.1 TNF receptor-associated factor 6 [Harpegnathos saltator]